MTAYHAVAVANIGKGSNVLITGGASDVNHLIPSSSPRRAARRVLTTVSSRPRPSWRGTLEAGHIIGY